MICQALFFGGPRWQTSASVSIFFFGPLLFYPLGMLWIGDFPGREFLSRRMPGLKFWAWFTGAIWVAGKLLYLTGTPFPSQHLPVVVSGWMRSGCCPSSPRDRNYLHADAVGRPAEVGRLRRLDRGVRDGLRAGGAGAQSRLALVRETLGRRGRWWAASCRSAFLIAIAATTCSTSIADQCDGLLHTLLLAALFALTLALVPRSPRCSRGWRVSTPPRRSSSSRCWLAALIVPLNRRLRPRVDRFFFPSSARSRGSRGAAGRDRQTRDEAGLLEAMARDCTRCFAPKRASATRRHRTGSRRRSSSARALRRRCGSTPTTPWWPC